MPEKKIDNKNPKKPESFKNILEKVAVEKYGSVNNFLKVLEKKTRKNFNNYRMLENIFYPDSSYMFNLDLILAEYALRDKNILIKLEIAIKMCKALKIDFEYLYRDEKIMSYWDILTQNAKRNNANSKEIRDKKIFLKLKNRQKSDVINYIEDFLKQ